MTNNTLQVKRLSQNAGILSYAHEGDAGLDIQSAETVAIPAYGRAVVGTGIAVAIPPRHVGLVHPRSGLAAKNGITVLNTPGTIDSGYRGEVKVILFNSTPIEYQVQKGDRIAQLVVQEVAHVEIEVVESFDEETERGEGRFGSSGT